MRCDEVQTLLSPYCDDELDVERRRFVEAHLEDCATCSAELESFHRLSHLAAGLPEPSPPAELCDRIAHGQQAAEPRFSAGRRGWKWWVAASIGIAAVVLIGVLLRRGHDHGSHSTVDLQYYLAAFAEDPQRAQQQLKAEYRHRVGSVAEIAPKARYTPAVASGLPAGCVVSEISLFDMPCCECIQTVLKHGEQTLVLFEHDDEHSFRFGKLDSVTCRCAGRLTRIIPFNGRIAASWSLGDRHLTLVGARDLEQVVGFVEDLRND